MTTPAAGETLAPKPTATPTTEKFVKPEAEPVKADVPAREKVVRYTGRSDKRIITRADWESLRIKGQDTVEFNVINDYELPASDFSPAALRYADKVDPGLKVIEA